jgi:hypothetical protein
MVGIGSVGELTSLMSVVRQPSSAASAT